MTSRSSSGKLFYGWYVAIGVGLTAFIAWGIGFYQLGVFVGAFHDDRGWSLAGLSLGPTLFYVVVGLASLVTGRIVDHYGPRRVLVAGALVLGFGMLLLGQVTALWQFYLVDVALAVGFASTSTLVLGAVVGRWFHRRRAFVMTLALSGAPLGALVLVPVSTVLIESYGITTGSRVLAALALAVVVPIALLVIRDDPAAHGWHPDGAPGAVAAQPVGEAVAWSVREAVATPVWRLLTLSFALVMLCQVSYLVHQIAFLTPLVGAGRASAFVSVTGAAGIAGRFAGGLGDRFPKHHLMAGYCMLQGSGVLLAALSREPLLLASSAALVGFTMGNTVALQPVLMAERFGMRSYGTVFGPASLLTQFGAAVGLTMVGLLADRTGGYGMPFALTGMLAVVAGLSAAASGQFALRTASRPAPAT